MSPTVFRWKRYRFFFFSREEKRMHIHVYCADGEGKFWLVPEISLATSSGLRQSEITQLARAIEDHRDEIAEAWSKHFRR